MSTQKVVTVKESQKDIQYNRCPGCMGPCGLTKEQGCEDPSAVNSRVKDTPYNRLIAELDAAEVYVKELSKLLGVTGMECSESELRRVVKKYWSLYKPPTGAEINPIDLSDL